MIANLLLKNSENAKFPWSGDSQPLQDSKNSVPCSNEMMSRKNDL